MDPAHKLSSGSGSSGPYSRSDAEQEVALIELAKTDREAFGALYRRYHPQIVNYLARRTANRDLAQDLASEVFVSALRGLSRYRARGIEFKHWLLRIASNEANRWAKKQRRLVPLPVDSELADHSEEHQEYEDTYRALRQISPELQDVLILHYLESLPLVELAAVLALRLGTVKSRLHRARSALARQLTTMRNRDEE